MGLSPMNISFFDSSLKEVKKMTLMRGFSKVDEGGKIPIPKNIRRETGLEDGSLVEIKVQGTQHQQYIIIKKRRAAR